MLSARIPKKKNSPARNLQPVLPLVPEALPGLEEDKSQFISLELRTRAGGPATSTYKKYVRKFEEGTTQQWIELLKDFEEIWLQNSINGGADRTATVRSLLQGDSLTAFNTALEEARTPEEQEDGQAAAPLAITTEMVKTALSAVTKTVFPHQALEIQRLWMQRGLRKPMSLTTRKTAAAITKINNALPLFPSGSELSKFSDIELIDILEWSLPQAWRMKFDLDGYIPTEHSKAKLIEACEAIERNQEEPVDDKAKKKSSSGGDKKRKGKDKGSGSEKKFFCTHHKWNNTHATADCYTLNKKKKSSSSSSSTTTLSNLETKKFLNTKFCKELNVLAKSTDRQELLEQYASAIAKEKARLKKSAKKKTLLAGSDSSDSDESCRIIEVTGPKKKKIWFAEKTEEEKNYLQKIREDSASSDSD